MTLLEVLKEARLPYVEEGQHHHARSGWVQLRDCPWCGSQAYHLGLSLSSRACACWRCGVQSTYATLIKLGVNPSLVQQALAGRLPARPQIAVEKKLVEPKGRREFLPAHRRYLKERHLDPDVIARGWNVQGIGISARLSWRLYIPVFGGGQVKSWTTRAIGSNVTQRYVSASPERDGGTNIKHLVYGLGQCHHSVIIVEGPLDVWAVGPGAAAVFGTAFTPAQVEQLASIPYRFICFDSEPPAQRKAAELARTLCLFPGVTSNILLDAKDPAEASAKELALLRQEAGLD